MKIVKCIKNKHHNKKIHLRSLLSIINTQPFPLCKNEQLHQKTQCGFIREVALMPWWRKGGEVENSTRMLIPQQLMCLTRWEIEM